MRRIIVKQGEHTIVELTLAVGVISVVMAPMLAADGAISALMADCTIEVERIEPPLEAKVPWLIERRQRRGGNSRLGSCWC